MRPRLVAVLAAAACSSIVPAAAAKAGGASSGWSSDSAGLIVFSCESCPGAETNAHLFTVRPDGTRLRIVPSTASVYQPRWSPDGRSIAFVHRLRQIWLARYPGSERRRLVRPAGAEDEWPTWSLPGRRLAFVRATPSSGAGSYRTSLWTTGADGARPRRVYGGDVSSPDWSPDGRRIAFSDSHEPLWVVNANGSGRQPLGPPTLVGREPRWSPDGTEVAFADAAAGTVRVFDVGSGKARTILDQATEHAWSLDGRWLAIVRSPRVTCSDPSGCERLEVWIVAANGSSRTRVWSFAGGETYGLDWGRRPRPRHAGSQPP